MTGGRQRVVCVLVVLAGLTWTVTTLAANGGDRERDARVRLRFGTDAPSLNSSEAVRRWVRDDLHRQLGLADTDHLNVDEPPRRLRDYRLVHLSQTVHGVPVVRRESRLLLDRDAQPVRLLGYHSSFPGAPAVRPGISVAEVVAMAGGIGRDETASRLVFWPTADGVRLSYELEGAFPDAIRAVAPYERVYVDASNGQVVERLPLVHRVLDRNVFEFAEACRAAGVRGLLDYPDAEVLRLRSPLVRSETANRGNRLTERLFDLFGSIHSFLEVILNRDSFDGAGGSLDAYLGVRWAGIPWQQCIGDEFNAGWHGDNYMLLPYEALDFPAIIAHEITHGLINSGANLVYERQPGALNESIADAIGVTFAAWLAAGAVRNPDARLRMAARDWQLRDPRGVMRDMRNPGSVDTPLGRYPDHYDDYMQLSLDQDHGGVHINSSIVNQGFYLLAEGGRHPRRGGPETDGIGVLPAARIFGSAAASILTPYADFEDARYAFAAAAEALHGPGSREWVAVHTAMDAVGIPGDWELPVPMPPPPPPPADPEPQGDTPTGPAPWSTPPAPDADAGRASDTEPEDNARVSTDLVVFSLIGGLALLGAAGLMLKTRARRSATVPRIWQGDGHAPRSPNTEVGDNEPPSTPMPTPLLSH